MDIINISKLMNFTSFGQPIFIKIPECNVAPLLRTTAVMLQNLNIIGRHCPVFYGFFSGTLFV